jgi:alkylated DNA repair dioxygenase AlkB
MSVSVQESLLDLGGDAPALGPLQGSVRRSPLARGAWVDFCPGWLAGSAEVFARLVESVPWRAEQRRMYDRVVAVPRLLCFYGEDTPLPDPVLTAAREGLNAHYGPELGEPFRTAGLCLYRDGRDSVAWHGDTIGRGQTEDTMVAIVSLGSPRPLLLRPRGGSGRTGARPLRFEVGHGDLLVMGGSCQRTWEHAVPKTSQAIGPRISVQFRPRGVR